MKNIYKLILCIIVALLLVIFKDLYQIRYYKKEHTETHIHKKQIQNKENHEKQTLTNDFNEFDEIDKYLKSKGFNGNITIYKNNYSVMSKAYGFRDIENGVENDDKSMYLLGSANKFVTGLMLRELEEQGVLI